MLESFLALDRALIELSMYLFNVPGRERLVLRVQNRRLHRAVRRSNATLDQRSGGENPRTIAEITQQPAAKFDLDSRRQRRSTRSARTEAESSWRARQAR